MPFKKTKFAIHFWLNTYLSNCDLLYKYRLKTFYKLPQLEKIILSLSLNKILFAETYSKNISSIQTQRLLLFFLFSSFAMIPVIKSNSLLLEKAHLKINESEYSLILKFLTEKQRENFLFFYFIEIWSYIKKNDYNIFFRKPFLLKSNNFFELKTKIPLIAIENFNIFFNPLNNQLIQEDSTFFLTFQFKDLNSLNSELSIKNLPFFWKNI